MPKWIPHKCKVCGRERSPIFHVSRRGLCTEHAIANVVEMVKDAQANGSIGGKIGAARRWHPSEGAGAERVGDTDR